MNTEREPFMLDRMARNGWLPIIREPGEEPPPLRTKHVYPFPKEDGEQLLRETELLRSGQISFEHLKALEADWQQRSHASEQS